MATAAFDPADPQPGLGAREGSARPADQPGKVWVTQDNPDLRD